MMLTYKTQMSCQTEVNLMYFTRDVSSSHWRKLWKNSVGMQM